MPRQTTIPETTVYQDIQYLQEFPNDKLIRINVGSTDADGKFLVPQQFQSYEIRNEMYEDLNSANPSWNPTKPAGTYFNEDLWHFIDILNS